MISLAQHCELCHRYGGYVLAFVTRIAIDMPSLSWEHFRDTLRDNGGFAGYAEIAVKNAFDKGVMARR